MGRNTGKKASSDGKAEAEQRVLVGTNRKARFHYEILDTFEAGISLKGPEVKSLRQRQASFEGAFARAEEDGLYLHNLFIGAYKPNALEPIPPTRTRRLLVHRRELEKLRARQDTRGVTIVPLEIYFRRGWAKVSLAVARGKRGPDKRASIRKRDQDRELERSFKGKI